MSGSYFEPHLSTALHKIVMKPGLMPTSDLELAMVNWGGGDGETLAPLMPLFVQWRGSWLLQGSLDVLFSTYFISLDFSGQNKALTLRLPHKHATVCSYLLYSSDPLCEEARAGSVSQ